MTAGGDRGDNTALCGCGDPYSGIGCADPDCTHRPAPAADRQTDEDLFATTVACQDGRHHSDCLSSCQCACHACPDAARPAVADAVMADPGAAITEGAAEARLREAVARELFRRQSPEHGWGAGLAYEAADELLALPEMRALLDAAAKVQRVEALGGEG